MNPLNASSAKSVLTAFLTLTTALGVSMAAGSMSDPAQARENISGNWYDDTGRGAVELYRCGTGMCGRIIWLRNPLSQAGTPLRDKYNPSPSDRRRPICGLQVIDQIKPQTDGSWDSGRIYDPKVGKTYDVAIERLSPNRLRITGYLGVRLFGKSFIWRRAPTNLPKCTASQ